MIRETEEEIFVTPTEYEKVGDVYKRQETTSSNEDVSIPKFMKIKEEVTNNTDYRNASLYRKINSPQKSIEKILKK